MNTRQYIEFKHLNDVIYAGKGIDTKSITLPSNEYIRQVLRRKGIDDIKSGCLIHVNLSKTVRNILIEGTSLEGMTLDASYLGKDGKFTKSASAMTEQAFILGDSSGIMNFKVEYIDGSVDYLQSFCSEDSYLVEQL
jgi:hypothetical protein